MPNLDIKIESLGDFRLMRLSGPVTVSTLVGLRDVFLKDFDSQKIFFAFDMAGVVQIDSSAMGLFINMHNKTDQKNGQVVLFGVKPEILTSLQQAGLPDILSVVRDEKEFRDNFTID